MRIPMVGPAYRAQSSALSAQRCINWYLEYTEKGGRSEAALYPTPGLILKTTLTGGVVRGLISVGSNLYAVAGSRVYAITTGFVATDIGGVSTASGRVSMAYNGTEIIIVDGTYGYIITIATSVVAQITDVDFPNGVKWATYLDQYFIVGGDGTQKFYISELLAGTTWVGTEFASAEGFPDNLTAGIVDHRELHLFGDQTAEIWVNTGNADFPIERIGNAFIEHGIAATHSVAKIDNTVFWLGKDSTGQGIVWRLEGYNPVRVSTHAIEFAIGGYSSVSDAEAYTYQKHGHSYYVLHFPTGDATWVYDIATGEWHQWSWYDVSTGTHRRHRSHVYSFFNGQHVVGDWENGKIYTMDWATYTDNADIIVRVRSTQTLEAEQKRMYYHQLQIDIEPGVGLATGQGSDPLMMMRYSNDGGQTWSNTQTATMGKIGDYDARCKWHRLGSGRNRVWEISVSDPVKAVVMGAVILTSEGSS